MHAQDRPQVFEGAEIIPITGEPISNGVLIVENGVITAVGKPGAVPIPDNAERVDLTGKVIMPGLVDTHSHIGEGDGGDRSAALHPDVRILDTIDPRSKTFRKAATGGLTSINIMPGSGLLLSGQTVYVKPKTANTIEEMLIKVDEESGIYGGLKMANCTNPLRTDDTPGTRAKSAALVRSLLFRHKNTKPSLRKPKAIPIINHPATSRSKPWLKCWKASGSFTITPTATTIFSPQSALLMNSVIAWFYSM